MKIGSQDAICHDHNYILPDKPLRVTPEDPKIHIEINIETVGAAKPSSSADGGPILRCVHCNYASLRQNELDTHVKQRHSYIGRDGKYKCEWCPYSSNWAADLKHHRFKHTGERPYRCAECGKSFRQLGTLITHRRIHTGQRPYSCDACGKAFKEQGQLMVHRRTHTGEKVRKCEQCGATFGRQGHYSKHMKSHKGKADREHQCQVCSAGFITRGGLSAHMRTHTGEKPFSCSFCQARFTEKTHLTKHVIRHHTHDYRHLCGRCGKGFIIPSRLRKHVAKCSVSI